MFVCLDRTSFFEKQVSLAVLRSVCFRTMGDNFVPFTGIGRRLIEGSQSIVQEEDDEVWGMITPGQEDIDPEVEFVEDSGSQDNHDDQIVCPKLHTPNEVMWKLKRFRVLVASWDLDDAYDDNKCDNFVIELTAFLSLWEGDVDYENPNIKDRFVEAVQQFMTTFAFLKQRFDDTFKPRDDDTAELDEEIDQLWRSSGHPDSQPSAEEPKEIDAKMIEEMEGQLQGPEDHAPPEAKQAESSSGSGARSKAKSVDKAKPQDKPKSLGKSKGKGKSKAKGVASKKRPASVRKKPAARKPKDGSISDASSEDDSMMVDSDNDDDDKPLQADDDKPLKARKK